MLKLFKQKRRSGNYAPDTIAERWADLALIADFRPTDTVLDIGSWEGLVSLEVAPRVAHVHGVELKQKWVKYAEDEARRRGIFNATFEARSALDYLPSPHDIILVLAVLGKDDDNGRVIGLDILERLIKAAKRQIIVRYNIQAGRRFSLRDIFNTFDRLGFDGVCFPRPRRNSNIIIGSRRGTDARIIMAPPVIVVPADNNHPCLKGTTLLARPEFSPVQTT